MSNQPTFAKPRRAFNDPVSPRAKHPTFIKPPLTNNVNLKLPLDVILPGVEEEIARAGALTFHALGDSGGIHGTVIQGDLAEQMQAQIEQGRAAGTPAETPRFMYHLGDVVYFNGISDDYPEQFYEPYQKYDAPIMAIPGNHDGDTRTRSGDPVDNEDTLFGFMQNFCAPRPKHIFKHRATMTQPYVYWTLESSLATIIGLYSNVDGELDAPGTFEQQRWLEEQLAQAPKGVALIIAVHHPAYSLDTSHGGYADIGAALERAFTRSGRKPHLVLSGHVHSYQRFTRKLGRDTIPYVIAGAGGYAATPRAMHKIAKDPATGQKPGKNFPTTVPGVVLAAYNDSEPGFLRLKVTKKEITGEYHTIDFEGNSTGVGDRFKVSV